MSNRLTKRSRAFTLVELLVVIGIIALLIGILLPTLAGARTKARDLQCVANIRSILQGMHTYAAENKGSLPWGSIYVHERSPSPRNMPGPGNPGWRLSGINNAALNPQRLFYSWPSLVGGMAKGKKGFDNFLANFPTYLKCPSVPESLPHIVSYAANMTVIPRTDSEYPYRLPAYTPGDVHPLRMTDLFPHNILIHDTGIYPGWGNSVGFLTNADIDGQDLWSPQTPNYRYFDPFDEWSLFGRGNQEPVEMDVGGRVWKNIDPPANAIYPFQGNIRFRHGRNDTINLGFADGHVESRTAKFNRDGTPVTPGIIPQMKRFEWLPKWPTGVRPNRNLPGG